MPIISKKPKNDEMPFSPAIARFSVCLACMAFVVAAFTLSVFLQPAYAAESDGIVIARETHVTEIIELAKPPWYDLNVWSHSQFMLAGDSSKVFYCMHQHRGFEQQAYQLSRETTDAEQAVFTLGYPANETEEGSAYVYFPGEGEIGWDESGNLYWDKSKSGTGAWRDMGAVFARCATSLAFWIAKKHYDYEGFSNAVCINPDIFYNSELQEAVSYLVAQYNYHSTHKFSMLRLNAAIKDASTIPTAPTKIEADETLELTKLKEQIDENKTNPYGYLEYRGFTASCDLPSRFFKYSLNVRYDGADVEPGDDTYRYNESTGVVELNKEFLKGKKPGDVVFEFVAESKYCPSSGVYTRRSTEWQDMLEAPRFEDKVEKRYLAPQWIEIDYRIVNDEVGEHVENETNLDVLRQSDVDAFHIITIPRVYSINEEAHAALIGNDFSASNSDGYIGDGITAYGKPEQDRTYYFFTDNWYTDAGCTKKFGPDVEDMNERHKAIVSESMTLYARWLEAKVDIANDPGWDDNPLNVGDKLTYTITYTNANDKPERVTLFDSPPANTRYIDGSARITRFRGNGAETSNGTHSMIDTSTISEDKSGRLDEHSSDERAVTEKVEKEVPDDMLVYSIKDNGLIRAG